ncbi:ribonuclease HII [Candidatus Sumerlaeota bacterium]|nr:ribonuclease HII [Candidatus Sumerlaeota bacterium]
MIGGVDEAGRGALAGPVVAAAVVLGPEARLEGVNDSKQLTPEQREGMVGAIINQASAAGVAMATAEEIDRINILQATLSASRRALGALSTPPEFLVTDHLKLTPPPCPMIAIAKGDATSLAVAAASVLAKVARDRIMRLLDEEYPQYGFARHKGYGTPDHLAALQTHGPSTIHRLSFAGVCWFTSEPTVWSRRSAEGELPRSAPAADWMALLRGAADGGGHTILPFLPEMEFRSRGGNDKVG